MRNQKLAIGRLSFAQNRQLNDPDPCRHTFFLNHPFATFRPFAALLFAGAVHLQLFPQPNTRNSPFNFQDHISVAMPPKKEEGFQDGKCRIWSFHEASVLRFAFTAPTNTR
jgi:hypothetical protein